MATPTVSCWEPTELATPILGAAEQLYESTIAADERIPWMWIERAVAEHGHRPAGWQKHLVLASTGPAAADLLGYAYGAFIPGYGGYVCYVGVADAARGRGVGAQLFEAMFAAFRADAAAAGESLPFVVWESHRPAADDPAELHRVWNARMRLFDKVGGRWIEGLELLTPNFGEDDPTATVPLQLFVKPMDEPADAFHAARLRAVAMGLLERVYQETPGDYFHDETVANMNVGGLRSAMEASPVAA